MQPDQPTRPDVTDASGPWTASLDPDTAAAGAAADKPSAARRRRIRYGVSLAALAVLAATWVPPLLEGPPPAPAPRVAVIGAHLDAPIELRLPAGVVTTSDDSYLGLRLPGGGAVLVTIPTEVVDPDGRHHRLPDDPAAWLRRNPAIFVSRVQTVPVDGVSATQVDYRWARTAQPVSRFASLQVFCGWRRAAPGAGIADIRSDAQACTRITSGARVRATFVPVRDRIVLVELVWRADAGQWPIPRELRQGYASLLQGLTPRPA